MRGGWLVWLLGWLMMLYGAMPAMAAPPPDNKTPVLLSADSVTYDQDNGLVVAEGNVEISQGDRMVLADRVIYNERTLVVTAEGNVSMLEPSGDVLFADHVDLTDDLRNGAIENIRLLMTDRSRMAAASGQRTGGRYTEMSHAVYSPCELCPEDRTAPPLWQLKAVRVVHDQEEHTIEYKDAWMEIYGVPIFYTPYFSHPDPTVKRQSGFLSPRIGGSDDLGVSFQMPYFWVLSPQDDITFSPLFTTQQSIVPMVEYRRRMVDGEINLGGSFTVADREIEESGETHTIDNDFRGHIDSWSRFDINDNWRWGMDANRATDKTYLRLYNISDDRTLTSRLFAEGFHGRNYLTIENYAFQGMRDVDDNDQVPYISPFINYSYVGEPGDYGGYYSFDAGTMVLSRIEGRDSRRVSVGAAWTLPYTAPAGDIYKFEVGVRGDLYWVNNVRPGSDDVDPTTNTVDDVVGRVFPQVSFEWRYPFVRHSGTSHQVIEPIVGAYAGIGGGNPGTIPNEDSQGFDFDDTNLFNPNRFSGYDRVDSGQRIDYGLRWSIYGDSGGFSSIFLGQSYRIGGGHEFGLDSGIEDDFSDVVGRLQVSPNKYLDLLYRFRFDTDEMDLERNEVGLRVGPPALNLAASYARLHNNESDLGSREEIYGRLASQVTDYWSLFASTRADLEENEILSIGGGANYRDECFDIGLSVTQTHFKDDEIDPGTRFMLTVGFKNLGAVELPF
jgi:LPS-assembly protein